MILSLKQAAVAALVILIMCASNVATKPYQELAPRKGYVPVYIRVGDTPLSEIHPKLAEAFHETELESKVDEKTERAIETIKNDEASLKIRGEQTEKNITIVEADERVTESDIASFDIVKKQDI